MKSVCRLSTILLLGTAFIACPAWAQSDASPPDEASSKEQADSADSQNTGLKEIIVTAERRASSVQRVAAAVSVRSGDDLRQQGKYSLNQILENVPGISGLTATGLAGLGSDSPENGIAIRGIKSNGLSQGLPQSATTAVYVDGIYSGVGGNYDIERVEVLRGPQGTLYGRSATGGVVATYTRNPNLRAVDGDGIVEIGNYQLRHYSAAVNVPLIEDKLAVRVSGDDYRQNGYIAPDGIGKISAQNLRVKVLAHPAESLSVLLGFALNNTDGGSGGITIRSTATPFVFAYDRSTPLGATKQKFRQYWMQADWDLGPVKLSYLPSLREYTQFGTAPTIGPGGQILIQTVNAPYDKFYTHELHLTSDTTSRFNWQVGAISFNNTARNFLNDIKWQDSGAQSTRRNQDRKVTDLGAFAEATYAIAEGTRFTGGLRYDVTKVDTNLIYTQNVNRNRNQGTPNVGLPVALQTVVVSDNATYKNFNYKARVEHDLGPGHLLYGGVSTGFIPGDLQISSTTPPSFYHYKAETLTAYEVGSKNRFFGDRLQANISAFYYAYGGFQQTITPNLADSATTVFVVQPARMYGGELELTARPTRFDQFDFNISYTKAYWINTSVDFRKNVAERTIFGIIPVRANAAYSHRFAFANGSELQFRGEVIYQGPYQLSNLTAATVGTFKRFTFLPHQFLGNLSLDWTSPDKRFGLTAYVRNVGDNVYPIGVAQQTATVGSATLANSPRTFGVVGRFNF